MTKIHATIQARMGSTRLPGKILKPITGKPMLSLQIERLRQSLLIDRIIIATTDQPEDDRIEVLACELDVACFRGSSDDVLGRLVGALKAFSVELNVEFQGDNPIPDPMLIDSIIGFYLKHRDKYDYVTNSLKTTFPPGTEVSVYPSDVLYEAEKYAADMKMREHVGIHIYQHPERFRIFNIEAPEWLHFPNLHLEVDTAEDFLVVKRIYEHFGPGNPYFSLTQAIEFAQSCDLQAINARVQRRWKSFRQDETHSDG